MTQIYCFDINAWDTHVCFVGLHETRSLMSVTVMYQIMFLVFASSLVWDLDNGMARWQR